MGHYVTCHQTKASSVKDLDCQSLPLSLLLTVGPTWPPPFSLQPLHLPSIHPLSDHVQLHLPKTFSNRSKEMQKKKTFPWFSSHFSASLPFSSLLVNLSFLEKHRAKQISPLCWQHLSRPFQRVLGSHKCVTSLLPIIYRVDILLQPDMAASFHSTVTTGQPGTILHCHWTENSCSTPAGKGEH